MNATIKAAVATALNRLATRENIETIADPAEAGFKLYILAGDADTAVSADFMRPILTQATKGRVRISARNAPALRFFDILVSGGFAPEAQDARENVAAGFAQDAEPAAAKEARAILRAGMAWVSETYAGKESAIQRIYQYLPKLALAYEREVTMPIGAKAAKTGHTLALSLSAWAVEAREAGKADRELISADQRLKAALDAIARLREHEDFDSSMLRTLQDALK